MSALAKRIAELRKQKKLSQIKFAEKFGVGRSTIAMWETGDREPDVETIQKLADFFDTSTDYLLGRIDEPHPLGYDPDKVEAIFAHRRDDYMQELSEADQKQIEKILKEIAHLVAQREKKKEDDDNGRD